MDHLEHFKGDNILTLLYEKDKDRHIFHIKTFSSTASKLVKIAEEVLGRIMRLEKNRHISIRTRSGNAMRHIERSLS